LVGEDGMIEVKCVTKLKDWIALDIYDKAKEHKDQIQFAMWRTGRKWCDFIAYQPRFKQPYDIKILRVFPDAEWIKFAEVRLPLCWSEIKRIKSNFLNA
jgi:exodeoxyribonuclease (lambda-induced)